MSTETMTASTESFVLNPDDWFGKIEAREWWREVKELRGASIGNNYYFDDMFIVQHYPSGRKRVIDPKSRAATVGHIKCRVNRIRLAKVSHLLQEFPRTDTVGLHPERDIFNSIETKQYRIIWENGTWIHTEVQRRKREGHVVTGFLVKTGKTSTLFYKRLDHRYSGSLVRMAMRAEALAKDPMSDNDERIRTNEVLKKTFELDRLKLNVSECETIKKLSTEKNGRVLARYRKEIRQMFIHINWKRRYSNNPSMLLVGTFLDLKKGHLLVRCVSRNTAIIYARCLDMFYVVLLHHKEFGNALGLQPNQFIYCCEKLEELNINKLKKRKVALKTKLMIFTRILVQLMEDFKFREFVLALNTLSFYAINGDKLELRSTSKILFAMDSAKLLYRLAAYFVGRSLLCNQLFQQGGVADAYNALSERYSALLAFDRNKRKWQVLRDGQSIMLNGEVIYLSDFKMCYEKSMAICKGVLDYIGEFFGSKITVDSVWQTVMRVHPKATKCHFVNHWSSDILGKCDIVLTEQDVIRLKGVNLIEKINSLTYSLMVAVYVATGCRLRFTELRYLGLQRSNQSLRIDYPHKLLYFLPMYTKNGKTDERFMYLTPLLGKFMLFYMLTVRGLVFAMMERGVMDECKYQTEGFESFMESADDHDDFDVEQGDILMSDLEHDIFQRNWYQQRNDQLQALDDEEVIDEDIDADEQRAQVDEEDEEDEEDEDEEEDAAAEQQQDGDVIMEDAAEQQDGDVIMEDAAANEEENKFEPHMYFAFLEFQPSHGTSKLCTHTRFLKTLNNCLNDKSRSLTLGMCRQAGCEIFKQYVTFSTAKAIAKGNGHDERTEKLNYANSNPVWENKADITVDLELMRSISKRYWEEINFADTFAYVANEASHSFDIGTAGERELPDFTFGDLIAQGQKVYDSFKYRSSIQQAAGSTMISYRRKYFFYQDTTGAGKTLSFQLPIMALCDSNIGWYFNLVVVPYLSLKANMTDRLKRHMNIGDAKDIRGSPDHHLKSAYVVSIADLANPKMLQWIISWHRKGRLGYLIFDEAHRLEHDEKFRAEHLKNLTSIVQCSFLKVEFVSATLTDVIKAIMLRFKIEDRESYYLNGVETLPHSGRIYITRDSDVSYESVLTRLRHTDLTKKTLVICLRIDDVNNLAEECSKDQFLKDKFVSLTGRDSSEYKELTVSQFFTDNSCSIIIGTQILTHGIDAPNVTQVISYDFLMPAYEMLQAQGRIRGKGIFHIIGYGHYCPSRLYRSYYQLQGSGHDTCCGSCDDEELIELHKLYSAQDELDPVIEVLSSSREVVSSIPDTDIIDSYDIGGKVNTRFKCFLSDDDIDNIMAHPLLELAKRYDPKDKNCEILVRVAGLLYELVMTLIPQLTRDCSCSSCVTPGYCQSKHDVAVLECACKMTLVKDYGYKAMKDHIKFEEDFKLHSDYIMLEKDRFPSLVTYLEQDHVIHNLDAYHGIDRDEISRFIVSNLNANMFKLALFFDNVPDFLSKGEQGIGPTKLVEKYDNSIDDTSVGHSNAFEPAVMTRMLLIARAPRDACYACGHIPFYTCRHGNLSPWVRSSLLYFLYFNEDLKKVLKKVVPNIMKNVWSRVIWMASMPKVVYFDNDVYKIPLHFVDVVLIEWYRLYKAKSESPNRDNEYGQ